MDETIFASFDKVEMVKAKIFGSCELGLGADFQVLILARRDNAGSNRPGPDSVGIKGNRGPTQAEMNPITIVFAGINDHLQSRGFLSRIREPTTADDAVWPAIKHILESMGEVMDTLREGTVTRMTPKAVFALYPGYAHLPDGLKFVYAMVALL